MLEWLLERWGEGPVLALGGLAVGLAFGAAAQHSRFCLRAATVELAQRNLGARISIWLVVFGTALMSVQGAVAMGWLDVSAARQLAATGSLSGAIAGGLMFGAGMILARGCASRLLVLSATGNLRAIVTGLVLTLVAQAAYRGALAPARVAVSNLWTVEGGAARSLAGILGLGPVPVVLTGAGILAAGIALARWRAVEIPRIAAAAVVGLCILGGWWITAAVAQVSFEVIPITSVTFTGPSADTLMGLINETTLPLGFGVGLVPGVVIGSAAMALLAGEWRIQRFETGTRMEVYLLGATLMGFGAMLAGGCAVGAGVSGGAILAVTAWVALFSMWVGAMATHILMSRRSGPAAVPA